MNSNLSYLFSNKGSRDLLVFMVWGLVLVRFLTGIFLRLPGLDFFAQLIVPIVFIVVIVRALPSLLKCIRVSDITFYFIIVFVYLVQYVLFPKNEEILNEYASRFILSSLPLFFIGLIIDMERYEKSFYIISVLCLIWAYYYSFVYMQQRAVTGLIEDKQFASMFLSYQYLPYVLFIIYYTFKYFSVFNLFLSIAGAFLIFSFGSRGPVVCLLLFLVGMIFFVKKFKHPVLTWIIIGVVLILSYVFLEQIVLTLQLLIQNVGMNSRVFDTFMESEMTESSLERISFIPILMSKIKTGGIWGYGICGSWQFIGIYPHNLLLDFWISFGMLPGSLLLIAIIVCIVRGFYATNTIGERAFLFLLTIRGFVMLFMSYTYLENSYLYMLIGYSVCLIRKKNAAENYARHERTSLSAVYSQSVN